jgi:hypothetical protein
MIDRSGRILSNFFHQGGALVNAFVARGVFATGVSMAPGAIVGRASVPLQGFLAPGRRRF